MNGDVLMDMLQITIHMLRLQMQESGLEDAANDADGFPHIDGVVRVCSCVL